MYRRFKTLSPLLALAGIALLSSCGSDEIFVPIQTDCIELQWGAFENCVEPHGPKMGTGTWVITSEHEHEHFAHHNVCGGHAPGDHVPPVPEDGEILVAAAFARTACEICLDIACVRVEDGTVHVELGGGSSGSCSNYERHGYWALIPDQGLPVVVGDPYDLPHSEDPGPCL